MRLTIHNSALFFASVSLLLVGGCGGGGSAANIEPTVRITSPPDGAQFTEGIFVTFRCAATDAEDGVLAGASLVWESSLDGHIGAGQSCTEDDLSVGTHIVTLTATDSGGASASDSITVHIRLPNQPPTASITSPIHGTTFSYGSPVAFQATAVDPEDGALTGPSLLWRSNLDGGIGVGESFALNDLSVGYHTITLTATDSEGASASDSVTIRIRLPNQPPAVSISSPSDGATFDRGTPVTFEGGAVDPEDGVLTGSSLVWTSSLDGTIGTGSSFTREDLSVGTHTITLTATDSEGASASHSISIEILRRTGTGSVYLIKTNSSGEPEWERLFGGPYCDEGYWVQQTADGGYVIAGGTESFGAGSIDVYVLKTDSSGNLEWQSVFGGVRSDIGYSVQQTADGGYVIVGRTSSFNPYSFQDVYMLKTDASGNLEWEKLFGGDGHDRAEEVQQTTDGGYVIAGDSRDSVYLLKTGSSGNLQWQQWYGGDGDDLGHSVRQTADGGYIVAGDTRSFGSGWYDVYLIKTDPSGNVQWQKAFGAADNETGFSVRQTSDGGYVISGLTESVTPDEANVYLLKTDSSGNLDWERVFIGLGEAYGWSVEQTSDGGYAVAGPMLASGPENWDGYLIKTDSSGNVEWQQTFGGLSIDWLRSVQQTEDYGYILVGYTEREN